MNRRLRSRHRLTFGLLAILLPVGVALAVATREPVPEDSGVRREHGVEAPAESGNDASASWSVPGLTCTTWNATGDRAAIVELRGDDSITAPDLLLYWQGGDASGEALDGSERLLGVFYPEATHRYELPEGGLDGALTLYSLAHKRVVAFANLAGGGN